MKAASTKLAFVHLRTKKKASAIYVWIKKQEHNSSVMSYCFIVYTSWCCTQGYLSTVRCRLQVLYGENNISSQRCWRSDGLGQGLVPFSLSFSPQFFFISFSSIISLATPPTVPSTLPSCVYTRNAQAHYISQLQLWFSTPFILERLTFVQDPAMW